MASNYIQNPHTELSPEVIKPLRCFAARKDAASWCKNNGVKPARVLKLRTRFQETYALDMGHNCFLVNDEMAAALELNRQGVFK